MNSRREHTFRRKILKKVYREIEDYIDNSDRVVSCITILYNLRIIYARRFE